MNHTVTVLDTEDKQQKRVRVRPSRRDDSVLLQIGDKTYVIANDDVLHIDVALEQTARDAANGHYERGEARKADEQERRVEEGEFRAVLTGRFQRGRTSVHDIICLAQGRVRNHFERGSTILVYGGMPDDLTDKFRKAQHYGVPMLSEAELWRLTDNGSNEYKLTDWARQQLSAAPA